MKQTHYRFVVFPSFDGSEDFLVYDSLLEQVIGQPQASIQAGIEMAAHLNRTASQPVYR